MRFFSITVFALSVLVSLTGCATPYTGVLELANEKWSGDAGLVEDAASTAIREGIVSAGENVIEVDLTHVRTGVVSQELQMKTAYGNDLIFRKGDLAYAVNVPFARYHQKSGEKVSVGTDPVEWCVVLKDGISADGSKPALYCALWSSSKAAFYVDSRGDYLYSPYFTAYGVIDLVGMRGELISIDEKAVDFGISFKQVLRVLEVNNRGVRLVWTESDGITFKRYKRSDVISLAWGQDAEVTFESNYGKLLFKKIGKNQLKVSKF